MGHAGHGSATIEQALVEAARNGSAAVFAALYERHAPPLLRLLVWQTGDRELAADLVQETFTDAWRSLNRLSTEYSFAAWLYTIARHNRLTVQRRERLRRWLSLDRLRGREEPVAAQLLDEAAWERDARGQALAALSPALREVLVLHQIGGYSVGEIAVLLGISVVAARQRLTRGNREFAHRYREQNA